MTTSSEPSTNGHGLELENLGDAASPGSTSPRMLVPLFVVPLLIVGVIVGLFLFMGSLLGKEKSVEQWIAAMETGGVNERWQAAAQISDIARSSPEKLADPKLRAKLREVFTRAGPTEPRIRQYLAPLWMTIADPEATPLIVEGIGRTRERLAHPESARGDELEQAGRELIFYVRALGTIATPEAEAQLLGLVRESDKGVREATAEALGMVGRKTVKGGGAPSKALVDGLLRLHEDDEAWVRMNAALALGKLGRSDGLATLEAMVDREWLRGQGLQLPDGGKGIASERDPAADPILFALATIESLLADAGRSGPAINRATLRAALDRAAADPNPDVKHRAESVRAGLQD